MNAKKCPCGCGRYVDPATGLLSPNTLYNFRLTAGRIAVHYGFFMKDDRNWSPLPLMLALKDADLMRVDANTAVRAMTDELSRDALRACVTHWLTLLEVHAAAVGAHRDTGAADTAMVALLDSNADNPTVEATYITAYIDAVTRLEYDLRDTTTRLAKYRRLRMAVYR